MSSGGEWKRPPRLKRSWRCALPEVEGRTVPFSAPYHLDANTMYDVSPNGEQFVIVQTGKRGIRETVIERCGQRLSGVEYDLASRQHHSHSANEAPKEGEDHESGHHGGRHDEATLAPCDETKES